ncbi:MAG: hypothetical protein MJ252_10835 [archaeon]|nr:hypothetical protein [archaeon]
MSMPNVQRLKSLSVGKYSFNDSISRLQEILYNKRIIEDANKKDICDLKLVDGSSVFNCNGTKTLCVWKQKNPRKICSSWTIKGDNEFYFTTSFYIKSIDDTKVNGTLISKYELFKNTCECSTMAKFSLEYDNEGEKFLNLFLQSAPVEAKISYCEQVNQFLQYFYHSFPFVDSTLIMRSIEQVWNQLINFEELSKLIYIDNYKVLDEKESLVENCVAQKDLHLFLTEEEQIFVKLILKDLPTVNKMILGEVKKISHGRMVNHYFFSIDLVEISKISCMVFFQSKFDYYLPMKYLDYFNEINLTALTAFKERISERVAICDDIC